MAQLGDRMKEYERPTNSFALDDKKPYIVRLDGHHFSRFLGAFNKPNDERIHRAMVNTTKELILRFKPSIAFTCSDEITLVFPVDKEQKKVLNIPFSGRIVKICTLMSGVASVSLYKHLLVETKDYPNLLRHVEKTLPHFDARAFNVPENYELVNNIKWRHLFDYRRNSISGLAHRHFGSKAIHGLHSDQLLSKMLNEKSIDWHSYENWYKWGTFVKLEKYRVLVWIGKNEGKSHPEQKEVSKFRAIIIEKELQKKYNEEDENFILSNYIDGTSKDPVNQQDVIGGVDDVDEIVEVSNEVVEEKKDDKVDEIVEVSNEVVEEKKEEKKT